MPDTATAPARLITVFNHRFDQNIPVLDAMYGERFPGLLHLVPFFEGESDSVAAVFESSHHFQGYFAQAADRIATGEHGHYAFVGDDVALHPSLDQHSLAGELGLGPGTAFIKELHPLSEMSYQWQHVFRGVRPFELDVGVDHASQLPAPDDAWDRASRHGYARRHLGWRNFRGFDGRVHPLQITTLIALAHLLRARGRKRLPYPLFMAYSDLFVVPAPAFPEFARICGVLAAMGVWVEVAIPTALALTCPDIATERDTRWRGVELWGAEAVSGLEKRHHRRLDELLGSFGDDQLYVHPVKLSRWETAS